MSGVRADSDASSLPGGVRHVRQNSSNPSTFKHSKLFIDQKKVFILYKYMAVKLDALILADSLPNGINQELQTVLGATMILKLPIKNNVIFAYYTILHLAIIIVNK